MCRNDAARSPLRCRKCGVVYHEDCCEYVSSKCAIFGCRGVVSPPRYETAKGLLALAFVVIMVAYTVIASTGIKVQSDEVVVRTYPWGHSKVLRSGEIYYPDFFQTAHYLKLGYRSFFLRVKFDGHLDARVSVTVRYALPQSEKSILHLHERYGYQREAEDRLFMLTVLSKVYTSAIQMTNAESLRSEANVRARLNALLTESLASNYLYKPISRLEVNVTDIEYSPEFQEAVVNRSRAEVARAMAEWKERIRKAEERSNRRIMQGAIASANKYLEGLIQAGNKELIQWQEIFAAWFARLR